MQLRTIVPTLALTCAAFSGAHAADVKIGGFVDAILNITDDGSDDTDIDFTADAVVQFMADIAEGVSAQVDLNFSGDDASNPDMRQAFITWEATESVSLQFGKSISWIGFQAAYAPGLWRIGVTEYASSPFYGNDTVGVWAMFAPSENVDVTIAVVDDLYGAKTETDSFAFGGEAVIGIEGYGSVELELMYDPSGADAYDPMAEADEAALGLIVHTTADQVAEGWTFGGEIAYSDYETAASMGLLAMANYGFHEKASGTAMISYYEPNDDADDDESIQFALAVLTTPTGDSNFAMNFELSITTYEDDAADDVVYIGIEALAVIP